MNSYQVTIEILETLSEQTAAYVVEHQTQARYGAVVLIPCNNTPDDISEELTARFGQPTGDDWTYWRISGEAIEEAA